MPYSFSTFRTSKRGLKDKTAEFMLSPTCLLFGGSTVVFRSLECILYNVMREPAYLGDIMSVFNLLGGIGGVCFWYKVELVDLSTSSDQII